MALSLHMILIKAHLSTLYRFPELCNYQLSLSFTGFVVQPSDNVVSIVWLVCPFCFVYACYKELITVELIVLLTLVVALYRGAVCSIRDQLGSR